MYQFDQDGYKFYEFRASLIIDLIDFRFSL